ncbi:DEAD/DEAH box helicase family protein [Antarctobacter sp.]|uniref:DEAD/DEAH box helicase family protein n=1 Tax=Antarctobacter sp. TaxID=1872577 RepID=UPI003A9483CB
MTRRADFSTMSFCHPWRSYQARLLAEMDDHLSDEKLHFVAAPGAGKTVLGLEIIRRLGRRTLILAPSLLVRDQWIARLVHDYLGGAVPDWIDTDIMSDAPVRVSTYQNIHTSRTKQLPPFDLLCLDEAHHLRRSWWRTLTRLAEGNACMTLSLTATPPYDVTASEWGNYTALCGPVDAEISVPELVRSGDLCPHQDLVYLAPAANGQVYQDNLETERALFDNLARDATLIDRLRADPWIVETGLHVHAILENPVRFSAMLVYLRHNGCPVPPYAKRVLQVNDADWPALDWEWLLTLFRAFPQEHLPPGLLARLKRAGALRNDTLTLPPPAFADRLRLLKNDQAKLDAMPEIYATERAAKGDALRMAILLDRIGKTNLRLPDAPPEFNTLGVFRHLLDRVGPTRMAVLTGQFAILPKDVSEGLDGQEVPGAAGYALVDGAQHVTAVDRANRAFSAGAVEIIIGTQSFLGQGWDAPALNALVLGTGLKSFVAVNQLRGRALRSFSEQPEKTSHIWHMAVVPHQRAEGEDVDRLRSRFACFVRLDRDEGAIHSDFDLAEDVVGQNTLAKTRARTCATLAAEWQAALVTQNGLAAHLRTHTILPLRHRLQSLPVPAMSFWGRLAVEFGRAPSVSQTRRVVDRIARMTIASLSELGDLPPVTRDLAPIVTWDGTAWQVGITATCKLDEAIFHEVFQQIFNPVDGPRYVISVHSGLLHKSFQYFAVPDRFGSHKDRATVFWRNWRAYIGRGTLVYTRTVAGRGVLQAARLSSSGRETQSRTRWH